MPNNSFRYFLASVVAVLTIGLSISAQNQVNQSKDETALISLVKQMSEAHSKFDPAALEKIYASDFIEISPVGEVDPREKTIGFYKPETNPDPAKAKPTITSDEFSIRKYDNFAVVITRITFAQTGNEPAARPPFSLRVTQVCRKEKGAWKISSAQYTGIRPSRQQQVK